MQIDKETLTMIAVVGSIVSSVVGAFAALVTTWLRCSAVKEKRFTGIQRKLAAWIAP